MIIGQAGFDLLLGILMVSFVAALSTGVVLVLWFIRREANLSELQADFVSKVSHELRTPLTAIRLFSETLERSKADPETQEECIKMLVLETEKLSRRIGRLLDWGRMEAGRKLFEMKPTPAVEVVQGAMMRSRRSGAMTPWSSRPRSTTGSPTCSWTATRWSTQS